MQSEIQRQTDVLRTLDEPFEPPYAGSRQYFSNLSLDPAPVSPRQLAQDDHRRQPTMTQPSRPGAFRPSVPSHLAITPRRYGSIGAGTTASSPSSLRYQVAPPPPPVPHPLIAVTTPPTDLPRRHTSADIRVHTWGNNHAQYNPEQSASHWPSSPKRALVDTGEDQRIRESFSSYSIQGATQNHSNASRPSTPPFGNSSGAVDSLGTWSWGSSRQDKFGGPSGFGPSGLFKDSSGPPTRRGSMAHILNPAETAERDEERDEELREEEDRKRKRLQ